jgi:hypothetical protein
MKVQWQVSAVTARGDEQVRFLIESLLEIVGLRRNVFSINVRKLNCRQQSLLVEALRPGAWIVEDYCKH